MAKRYGAWPGRRGSTFTHSLARVMGRGWKGESVSAIGLGGFDPSDKTLEALFERAGGAAEVQANVGVTRGAEEVAVAEADAVGLKVRDGVGEVEGGDVDPGEIGGFLRGFEFDAREMAKGGRDEVAVGAERAEQALAPVLGLAVGGFTTGETERSDFRNEAEARAVEATAEIGVGNDGERATETGDVVGLAGGH